MDDIPKLDSVAVQLGLCSSALITMAEEKEQNK